MIVQLAPGERDVQVLVWPKSAAFAPVTATPRALTGAEPVLVSVTVCGALGVPTSSPANVRPIVETETSRVCNRIETPELPAATARSSLPSRLKSPTATDWGNAPARWCRGGGTFRHPCPRVR